MLVYQFGFDEMRFNKSHFEVLKNNKKVISFHTRLGAEQSSEDDEYCYFNFHKETYIDKCEEFKRLIS